MSAAICTAAAPAVLSDPFEHVFEREDGKYLFWIVKSYLSPVEALHLEVKLRQMGIDSQFCNTSTDKHVPSIEKNAIATGVLQMGMLGSHDAQEIESFVKAAFSYPFFVQCSSPPWAKIVIHDLTQKGASNPRVVNCYDKKGKVVATQAREDLLAIQWEGSLTIFSLRQGKLLFEKSGSIQSFTMMNQNEIVIFSMNLVEMIDLQSKSPPRSCVDLTPYPIDSLKESYLLGDCFIVPPPKKKRDPSRAFSLFLDTIRTAPEPHTIHCLTTNKMERRVLPYEAIAKKNIVFEDDCGVLYASASIEEDFGHSQLRADFYLLMRGQPEWHIATIKFHMQGYSAPRLNFSLFNNFLLFQSALGAFEGYNLFLSKKDPLKGIPIEVFQRDVKQFYVDAPYVLMLKDCTRCSTPYELSTISLKKPEISTAPVKIVARVLDLEDLDR
jgi:hypothetical protein